MPDTEIPRGSGRKGDVTKYMYYINDFGANTNTNRKQQTIDVNYYHGNQLTAEERTALAARRQPAMVINRVRAAVNGILGVQIEQNSQPKAWPRTPEDEQASDVATDTLRYLKDVTNLKQKRTELFEYMLNAGVAGVDLSVTPSTGEIELHTVAWNELIYDPRSRKKDFSDAKYLGIQRWVYADDVKAMYPDASFDPTQIQVASGMSVLEDGAGDDRPRFASAWVTPDQQRVLLVQLLYREGGTWYKCVFTAAGVLEEGESWLKDGKGRSQPTIIAGSVYVDDDNNRVGTVRDMRPIQDEINKRRSKLLHLLSVAQIQAKDPSAIEVDAEEARKEAARPDGIIPFGWERVRNQDLVQGQAQLLAESKAEIERMGPNPAVLGRQGSDTSGKALNARQAAGMTELAVVFDQLDDLELRIYRALWYTAKQFWTAPMYIRVTDDAEDPRFVMLNQPQMGMVQGVDQSTGQPAVDPTTGQPVMVQDVLGYDNQIAQLDVDLILENVKGTANLQAEQLSTLMDLIARNPSYAQIVPPSVMFELTPMPRKRDLMKKVKAAEADAQQRQQQVQEQQMQLEQQKTQSEIDLNESGANLNDAKAEELGFNAETYAQQTHNSLVTSVMNVRAKQQSDAQKAQAGRSNGNPSPGS